MNAQTTTFRLSNAVSSISCPASDVDRIPAIPARKMIARIGSCRASAASSESSRSAANVACG